MKNIIDLQTGVICQHHK